MSQPRSINALPLAVMAIALLAGCTTNKDKLLPHGEETMMDVWQEGAPGGASSSSSRQVLDARLQLRRPLDEQQMTNQRATADDFARTAQNEIYSQFKRLPNPDLVMYVFPHLAGSDPVPVPGYTTVFPLYQRVQYAMPGERTEDY
ncbi:TIGR03751 family conjugal transfer lipoprotein [Pseudomonas protegens]|uniref:Conjugative transfer region lipoprotein, TIGR03751 family n=2 Tax=Pseudomonas protegens TaxID=380021 RepID=F9XXE5_PSEF5|nr:TIGR03751 family conjugal transfer lipoprotein [Pseudomonas protegens]AEK81737.1 conjugative transfer region lipoprotein, TIGR03751 family [Pseudomonas protegens Pf-5]ASE21888.1 TIGR03751 family conjugal transfer lipoprotein [Pseudomonas protegens]OBZ20216.1 conjugal transfer protein [Pseudomonas protegens]OBZ21319.1 conjugal transfer protein [Pseudomonas protegens]OKK40592.1 conjugal transfer protein [Pseudomonas protegens]